MVLTHSLHYISSRPLLMDQGILQGEGAISGPSNPFTHRRAAQFQSYLVHNSAQIFLSVVQTLDLCDREKQPTTTVCKCDLWFTCGSVDNDSPKVKLGGWK